jgi:metal-sulfur cluster biosynthetic enzyme
MFIQTEAMPDPAMLRFLPGREVLAEGARGFRDQREAAASPLAEKLFAIEGVSRVEFARDSITITRSSGDWQHLKPAILGVVMEHFMTGAPVLRNEPAASARSADPSADGGGEFDRVKESLRQVIDPELGYNIVDLGLVYDIAAEEGGVIRITMTTTTPGCPATNYLKTGAGEAAGALPGVEFVDVQLTYEPRWTPEFMSPEAKAHFGIDDGGGW